LSKKRKAQRQGLAQEMPMHFFAFLWTQKSSIFVVLEHENQRFSVQEIIDFFEQEIPLEFLCNN
jgi:hypothetical protein